MKLIVLLTPFLMGLGCTQQVHVKVHPANSLLKIDGMRLGRVPSEGAIVPLPTGFGPLTYELKQEDHVIMVGSLPRTQVSWGPLIGSVVGAAVASPLLAVLGVFVANPLWFYASSVIGDRGGGAFSAYQAQTLTAWTVPVATLFALIGLTPLLGLLRAEQLPFVVEIGRPLR